jgi:5-methyltetrahydropteroyltriglutamate--homocysteine methyltransferase
LRLPGPGPILVDRHGETRVILAALLSNYPRIGDRPDEQVLRRAIQRADRGEISPAEVAAAEDEMTRLAIADQAAAGLDVLTDGQIRWHDPVSHVARGLAGFRIEGLLRYFDTNTYYRQPAVTGPVGREKPFLVEAYRFAVGAAAPRPVKAIVTGPLTMARLSRDTPRRGPHDLTLQIASALNREILDLEAAGAGLIQIDEPAIARHPEDAPILRLAMRRLVTGLTTARILLATSFGDATPLAGDLALTPADLIGLDARSSTGEGDAGAFAAGLAGAIPGETGVALGIVDGRNTRLESADATYERLARPILQALVGAGGPKRTIHLTTSHGLEFLPRDVARAKMSILAAVRDRARQEFP